MRLPWGIQISSLYFGRGSLSDCLTKGQIGDMRPRRQIFYIKATVMTIFEQKSKMVGIFCLCRSTCLLANIPTKWLVAYKGSESCSKALKDLLAFEIDKGQRTLKYDVYVLFPV